MRSKINLGIIALATLGILGGAQTAHAGWFGWPTYSPEQCRPSLNNPNQAVMALDKSKKIKNELPEDATLDSITRMGIEAVLHHRDANNNYTVIISALEISSDPEKFRQDVLDKTFKKIYCASQIFKKDDALKKLRRLWLNYASEYDYSLHPEKYPNSILRSISTAGALDQVNHPSASVPTTGQTAAADPASASNPGPHASRRARSGMPAPDTSSTANSGPNDSTNQLNTAQQALHPTEANKGP